MWRSIIETARKQLRWCPADCPYRDDPALRTAPVPAERTRSSTRPHPFPPSAPVVTAADGANGCAGGGDGCGWCERVRRGRGRLRMVRTGAPETEAHEDPRQPRAKTLSPRAHREYPVYAQRELLDFPVRELLGTVYSLKPKQHHSRAEVAPCSTTRRDGAKPRSDES